MANQKKYLLFYLLLFFGVLCVSAGVSTVLQTSLMLLANPTWLWSISRPFIIGGIVSTVVGACLFWLAFGKAYPK